MNKDLKIVCLIPARLASTRLPQKLIQLLDNYSVIQHTYRNALASNLFTQVIVVGDDEKIKTQIDAIQGEYIHTTQNFECGTDRIASVASAIDADIIINLQGDEPFVDTEALAQLINLFADQSVQVGSLMYAISAVDAANPNYVKVVTDIQHNALLFSRSKIPYNRDNIENVVYYKHIGIYAFRKQTLMAFAQLPISHLEHIEKLENLRLLQNGIPIRMVLTDTMPIGIDTEADLQNARNRMT